jgi:hypothetical protein
MLDINEFKAAVTKRDLERSNLFAITVDMPKLFSLPAYDWIMQESEKGKLITFMCKDVVIPSRFLSTTETRRYGIGPMMKMPSYGGYSDLTMTFMNDNENATFAFFNQWIRFIYNTAGDDNKATPGKSTSYQLRFKDDYESTINVFTLGGETGSSTGSGILSAVVSAAAAVGGVPFVSSLLNLNNPASKKLVKKRRNSFHQAYPTSISEIKYSSADSSSITEFSVTFSFVNATYEAY